MSRMGMERWVSKVAVVTGASSGIGAAIASDLAKAGLKVVALARREKRLQENKDALPEDVRANYYFLKCDVTKESEVKAAFQWVENNLGGTDILINNAGAVPRGGSELITPDNTQSVREVLETNVMAMVYCVREAFNSIKNRNVDGHVVLMNSMDGHEVVIFPEKSFQMYCPSKYAVTAMTEIYRQEFLNAGTKIKVTSISPGGVNTEIIPDKSFLDKLSYKLLNPEDISNAVLFALGTPPHVQIHDILIRPIGEML